MLADRCDIGQRAVSLQPFLQARIEEIDEGDHGLANRRCVRQVLSAARLTHVYRVATQSAKINDNHNTTWHYTFGSTRSKMADFCGFQHLNRAPTVEDGPNPRLLGKET
jgi:hypothetical protein